MTETLPKRLHDQKTPLELIPPLHKIADHAGEDLIVDSIEIKQTQYGECAFLNCTHPESGEMFTIASSTLVCTSLAKDAEIEYPLTIQFVKEGRQWSYR